MGSCHDSVGPFFKIPHVGDRPALEDACWSPPPLPKDRRLRLIDFPIKKFIIARPRVDLGRTNLTAETSRMLVWMFLPCRGVRQPAIGTAKIFGRPYIACHPASMRRTEHVFQPSGLPQSMTYYSNPRICRSSDSAFLTPRLLNRVGANSVCVTVDWLSALDQRSDFVRQISWAQMTSIGGIGTLQ
jgi:hypothetical protein